MISEQEAEHLRFYKSIVNTGTVVVRDFVEPRLLKDCPNGFNQFLSKEKHNFYHQWDSKKIPCCECQPSGCTIHKNCKLDQRLFELFYKYNKWKTCQSGQAKRQNGFIAENCICKYIEQNVDLDALDLTYLHFLIRHFNLLNTPQEEMKIKVLLDLRNKIMHAIRIGCYCADLPKMWIDFEGAALFLSLSERLVKNQLKREKEDILSERDIRNLKVDINAEKGDAGFEHNGSEMTQKIINALTSSEQAVKTQMSNQIQTSVEQLQRALEKRCQLNDENITASQQELSNIIHSTQSERMLEVNNAIQTSAKHLSKDIQTQNTVFQQHIEDNLKHELAEQLDDMKRYFQKEMGGIKTFVKFYYEYGKDPLKNSEIRKTSEITRKMPEATQEYLDQTEDVSKSTSELGIGLGAKPKQKTFYKKEPQPKRSKLLTHQSQNLDEVSTFSNDPSNDNCRNVNETTDNTEENRMINVSCKVQSEKINELSAVKTMTNRIRKFWQVKSAKKNCVYLELEMSAEIFKDIQTFQVALLTLIKDLMQAGEILENTDDMMTLDITIKSSLTNDERANLERFIKAEVGNNIQLCRDASDDPDPDELKDEVLSSVDFCGDREEDEIRIVLIGRTGAGKSSTGNTLLRQKTFFSQASGSSVTEKCQIGKGKYINRKIVLVDTPGLFDTKFPQEEVTKEIIRCINMSLPGPHVFLLVLRLGRITEEEIQNFKSFFELFGEEISNFAVITFTRLDDLEHDNVTVEDFLKTSNKELKDFLKRCQNRYIAFNNTATEEQKEEKVAELIELVNKMINQNNGKHYTNEMYKEAEANLQKKISEVKRIETIKKANAIEKIESKFKAEMEQLYKSQKELSIRQNQFAQITAKRVEQEKILSKIQTKLARLNLEHDRELLQIKTQEKERTERQLEKLETQELKVQQILQNAMQQRALHRDVQELAIQRQTEFNNIEIFFKNQIKQAIEDNNEQIRLMRKQLAKRDLEYERRMNEKDRIHQQLLESHDKAIKQLDNLTDIFHITQKQNEHNIKTMQEEYEQKMEHQREDFGRRLKEQEEKHKKENETKEDEKEGNGCVLH